MEDLLVDLRSGRMAINIGWVRVELEEMLSGSGEGNREFFIEDQIELIRFCVLHHSLVREDIATYVSYTVGG